MKSDTSPAAKTRRRYAAEFKRQLVRMSLVPGASAAKIALEHQLNANLLFKWRRLYLRELAGTGTSIEAAKLLPVTVREGVEVPDGSVIAAARCSRRRDQARSSGTLEIELPEGCIRVNGVLDIARLRAVVRMVRGR